MVATRGYIIFWVFLLVAASLYWGLLSNYHHHTSALQKASSNANSKAYALHSLMNDPLIQPPLRKAKKEKEAQHIVKEAHDDPKNLIDKHLNRFELKKEHLLRNRLALKKEKRSQTSILDVSPPLRKIQHGNNSVPDLFMQRLNRLLPDCPPDNPLCDDHIRLFPDDVAKIEREILAFDIPNKTIIKFPDSEYISIQYWKWLNQIDKGKMCPNCELRHNSGVFKQWNQFTQPDEKAHVLFYFGCVFSGNVMREHDEQVLIGGCGESQAGSGRKFFSQNYKKFHYDGSFHDRQAHRAATRNQTSIDLDMEQEDTSESNLFTRSYIHLHFAPDNQHGFPELRNVTDVVRLLLRDPPPFPRNKKATEDASFTHNNCGGIRAQFLKDILAQSNMTVARYSKCLHNKESGLKDRDCSKMKPEEFFHRDCEAHRDASKTIISSWHKFTFALENTLSPDYFTEKRFQVLYAGSVPIVWGNHNSKAYLPDPDAAIIVDPNRKSKDEAREIGRRLHNMSEEEYQAFFAWKKRGLRPSFVRKIFLSTDFQPCRICEYMAHHYSFSI